MDAEDIECRLTPTQIDVLRSSLICGMSVNNYCSKEAIETQIFDETKVNLKEVIKSLTEFNPPLIESWEGDESYHFTIWGAEVAKYIIRNPRTVYAEQEVTNKIPRTRIGRGNNNRLMQVYAEQNKYSFIKIQPRRCTYCNHKNEVFVRKGMLLLCQVCFTNGLRF